MWLKKVNKSEYNKDNENTQSTLINDDNDNQSSPLVTRYDNDT